MRRLTTFACGGDTLVGTLDEASGTTGVLVVSGGNEVRSGAHRGMALLAQALAAASIPVFRFDRRGVGDSEGENHGYASSGPDIAAALDAFRAQQPQLARVIGFGNCDGATALLLHDSGCDALVLTNPWLGDEAAPAPPAAVRRHYWRKLRDPRSWGRLVSPGAVARARQAFGRQRPQPLAKQVADALAARPATIVLATGDRTAQVFDAAIRPPPGTDVIRLSTASHSFAGEGPALLRILIDAADAGDKGVR